MLFSPIFRRPGLKPLQPIDIRLGIKNDAYRTSVGVLSATVLLCGRYVKALSPGDIKIDKEIDIGTWLLQNVTKIIAYGLNAE